MKTAQSFAIPFNPITGLTDARQITQRKLSKMENMFADTEALKKQVIEKEDPLVYEFYELDVPETSGDVMFGTSVVYPGKVGNEYFMTKGHFHTILETGEVYYCLGGEGQLLMENPEGDIQVQSFAKGTAIYVPPRYAHRSINTGTEPLVMFFAFRGDAGHDYGTIESKGYRKLVVEENGVPTLIDNPKW